MTRLRCRTSKAPAGPVSCRVCRAEMMADSQPKTYCLMKKVCPTCLQADAVQLPGTASLQRFCHQCGKFEDIARFDGDRRTCRDRLAKRRKQAACCLSRDSTPKQEHQEAADADSAPMAANSPAWSCYGYGADNTVACSVLDGSASDTSGMLIDLDLQRHLEQSLAACAAVPSTDEPACQLPQLLLPQGFMGMPAACSAAVSPSDAADDDELDFVAAAMQKELQQCLQEQLQQQAAAAAFSSCGQQALFSGFQATGFTSFAVQPGSLAARPWCDNSNNSSTLPVVDVCSGLVSQPVAAHAAGAYCGHSSSDADAAALARQARLQELLVKRRELEDAAAELQALQGALSGTTPRVAVGPSAQLQRLTSMPAQFPAEHTRSSSTPAISAHVQGQSGGLFKAPTASSGVLAAAVQEVHMPNVLVPDRGAAVVQKLNHLQSQLEQMSAQFTHLRQVAAGTFGQATPSSKGSTSGPIPCVSMF